MAAKKGSIDVAAAFEKLKKIQTLTLTALYSDDSLMERLVLKGGTALDLVHEVGQRASIDLDLSMEGDFAEEEKERLPKRLEELLQQAFEPEGLTVFDVTFVQKPRILEAKLDQFWGGYKLEFKLIEREHQARLGNNMEAMRREAMRVGPSQNSKFEIEISRFEYCSDKEPKEINGFTVFVYRPRLIVCEKLRAICQQMPEYQKVVPKKKGKARARDFFDIYNVIQKFDIDVRAQEFRDVLKQVLDAKHVPLELLGKIRETRALHAPDFAQVLATVTAGTPVLSFDEYFDFVVGLTDALKVLWDVQPPAL